MVEAKVVKGLILNNLRGIRKNDFKRFRLAVFIVILEDKYQLRVGINSAPANYEKIVTHDYNEWQQGKSVDTQLNEILNMIDSIQRQALRKERVACYE